MYVSHFNSFLRGGASTAAQQLHLGLLSNGIRSRFQHLACQEFVDQNDRSAKHPEYYPTFWKTSGLVRKTVDGVRFRIHREHFKRATRGAEKGAEVFTSPRGKPSTLWPPIDHPAALGTDEEQHIIHLHWIAKFIDIPSFFGSLPEHQPVVWTLHDMNALTGGCHFSGGCQRFRIGCGNCPQARRSGQNDISFQSFETKRRALAGINLHVVAPSRWLLDLAQSSPLLSEARSFSRIPYGMPTDTLYPMDRLFAREALGIKQNAFIICFGAMNLESQRKGASELLASLKMLGADSNIRCLVFGAGSLRDQSENLPEMIEVGRVQDSRTRRLVYSAADVFVLPSTEDNLPLTGLEAMACGTPVIGFAAGGIPDYVIPGKTGMLAENGNSAELAQRLQDAASNPARMSEMGDQARKLIVQEFEFDLQAKRYVQLYESIRSVSDQIERRAA